MDENRIPYLATPGGKTETIARDIQRERQAAQQARLDYLKTKEPEIINLWGSERAIVALILKPDTAMPKGWRRSAEHHRKHSAPDNGTFIVPDGKSRDTYKNLVHELRGIPSLPDSAVFSQRIGFGSIIQNMRMLWCGFEVIDGKVVVSVPRFEKPSHNLEEDSDHKKQFEPADCTQLKLSEYYAMKEAAQAVKGGS